MMIFFTVSSLYGRLFFRGVAFGGLAVEELADQLLEDDRRLRELQRFAVGEIGAVAARFEPDVLLTEQPGGQYRCGGVFRKLEFLFDRELDARVEARVVEPDRRHAPDDDPCALHRRARLQSADVVEIGIDRVALAAETDARDVADFHGEHQQRSDTGADEESDPQVEFGAIHQIPRNMNEVSRKSRPSIASDDVTTVRVVAPETPSAVGGAS